MCPFMSRTPGIAAIGLDLLRTSCEGVDPDDPSAASGPAQAASVDAAKDTAAAWMPPENVQGVSQRRG